MRFDCVVFDFDGTLADTSEGIFRCTRAALEQLDQPIPDEGVLRKFIGPPLYTSFTEFCGLSDGDAKKAIELYRARYGTVGLFEARIYPGIPALLKDLKDQGTWVAVASAKPEVYLRRVLDRFGLTQYLDAVSGNTLDELSLDKQALIRAALPDGADPGRACMVGDRCFDIAAGAALGMKTAAVTFGFGTREEFDAAGADFMVEDVSGLRAVLEAPPSRGRFITFEGSDGCGKSTQIRRLNEYLTQRGWEVVLTREPGGCPVSERIREIILSLDSKGMTAQCEALLYAASRIEHVHKVILPALNLGKIVLCDRFLDSSIAYQAYGRELEEDFVRQINREASRLVTPDCTLLFEVDRSSAKARMAQGAPLDRLELEREDFFERVRAGYDRIARESPARVKRIDGSKSIDAVFEEVLRVVKETMIHAR